MKIVSENIITAAEKIIPYSTVLPINDSDYWIFDHISNYLGADKPMVIFENYEASQNYFPLKWKQNVTTQFNFKEEVNNHGKVDYVFIFTNTLASQIGKNEKRIIFSLESDYNLIYLSEDRSIKLFKKKNN